MPAVVPYCILRSESSQRPDESAGRTLLMPRMSLAGSRPMGSSMRFTAKKMELPARHINNTHHPVVSQSWHLALELNVQNHIVQ